MSSLGTKLARVSLAVSTAVTVALASPAWAVVKNFISVINSGQEVPPTASNAFGNGFYTFDTQTGLFCWSISYSSADLLGAETDAYFRGPASPGNDGILMFSIPLGSPKQGCQTLGADQEKSLMKGQIYVQIQTSVNTSGEIRGQIIPVKGR